MDLLSKIADYIIEPVGRLLGRQVGYVIRCKSNLEKLKDGVEKLKATKDSVANEVDEAKRRGEKIQPYVQLWLKNVDNITAKTDELLKDENQAKLKCIRGFCPNLTTRHQLSRESTKLVPEVVALEEERQKFTTVSCGIIWQDVSAISTGEYHAFQSRGSTVEKIMVELQNPNTNRIGVYGIGGVGKTTLMEQVYRQALALKDQKNLFDDVVLILDVKANPHPEAIQKKIVEKLGMKISESEGESMDKRASRLCGRIQGKKVLVIMDDVWERIDLKVVGIPDVATCKILLTSRSRIVLSAMDTQSDFMLNILEEEETWVLFEKKAGDVVKDPAIRTVATQVAKYCRGLPVLIVTVASALKKRTTLPPWKDALRCLTEGSESKELTESAYLGLKWSYSQLNDEELKPLFLLCGITIRRNNIILKDLLRYSMGLGFFGKAYTVEQAQNALYSRVEKLKDFCLLIDSGDNRYVRMHDLVRDVANWIAFKDQHILSSVVPGDDGGLKEWPDKDFLEKCTTISFPRGHNIPRLPEVMQCPALKMFLLVGDRDDDPVKILPRFFEEMKQLNVLGLENIDIPSLPSSFQSLKHVQTLCLEKCNLGAITLVGELSNLEILSFAYSEFEQLPKEIAQLTHLRLLDLTDCFHLQVISPGVISSLTRLEDLRMNCFDKWEAKGEGSNASLFELEGLSRLAALEIQIPDAEILPPNLFSCKLERYQICIGSAQWTDRYQSLPPALHPQDDTALNILKFAETVQLDRSIKMLLKKSGHLYLAGTFAVKNTPDHQLDTGDFQQVKHLHLQSRVDFTYIINKKVVLPNLTTLGVNGCDGLKFLFSSSMARSLVELKYLEIESCEIMEEIILSSIEDNEENMDNMFPKLQYLILHRLPKLVRFSTSSYIEFSSLEALTLEYCYELGPFICGPKSEERESEDVENENALPFSLFDEKVGFRSLERLQINGLRKLKTIWHNQVAHRKDSFCRLQDVQVSFCRNLIKINIFPLSIMGRLNDLKTLRINDCDSLQNILPVSVARDLQQQLHDLIVTSCHQLEGIIVAEASADQEVKEPHPPEELVFRKVTSLEFRDLPRLKSFYTAGMLASKWPSLKRLHLVSGVVCPVFASQVSFFREKMNPETTDQPFFLIHKDSFPELEELTLGSHNIIEIWYGDGPSPAADLFPKLKSVCFYGWVPFTKQAALVFLEKLQNLEKVEVSFNDSNELFVDKGSGTGHALPRVRYLTLCGMYKLLHLAGNQVDKSQSAAAAAAASPVLPNLHFLEVDRCSGLNSLDPQSAISFRNLTTLKVIWCSGLKYLMSYSVAKSLVQLTTLQVDACGSLEVIIATDDGDNDDNAAGNDEIAAFNCTLQYLDLCRLPHFQGFCSRNSIVKFPSLQTFFVFNCNTLNISHNADGVLQMERRQIRGWPIYGGNHF